MASMLMVCKARRGRERTATLAARAIAVLEGTHSSTKTASVLVNKGGAR